MFIGLCAIQQLRADSLSKVKMWTDGGLLRATHPLKRRGSAQPWKCCNKMQCLIAEEQACAPKDLHAEASSGTNCIDKTEQSVHIVRSQINEGL